MGVFKSMLLIWQGFGLLAIAVPMILILLVSLTVDQIYGEGFYSSHSIWITIALLISAVIL